MRGPSAAPLVLTLLALSRAAMSEVAAADEAITLRSGVAITALPVRSPLETPEASFADVALRLIGKPDAETLGVSVRATVVPKTDLTGKEKLVAYFYSTCDDEPPVRSAGVLVATLDLAALPAGRTARSIVATGTVSALVPVGDVSCAKLALLCQECGEASASPAAYGIRHLAAALDPHVQDFGLDDPSLALVGEPASKSFGVAFRGTVQPTVELTGNEKAVIRLYTGCAEPAPGPDATNVATVELGGLRSGSDRQRLVATKDATAFVPLQDIGCAVVDME